ncbi:unnamed protein product, partial [marine sediment metagenome]
LRSGARELGDLFRRRRDIGRIGIRHRLHDDRRRAADVHAADRDTDRGAPRQHTDVRE